MYKVFTIGYANKEISHFVSILKKNGINCVIDVRSTPYSKQYPNYNVEYLRRVLNYNKIYYFEFGEYFGARRNENETYKKIKLYTGENIEVVEFNKVYLLKKFREGVLLTVDKIKKHNVIAFMCSEKYPFDCHRCIMVSEYFNKKGIVVEHIVDEKNILSNLDIDEYIKNNFYSAKKLFERKNNEELKNMLYASNIFGVDLFDSDVKYWIDFFKDYNREKGYYLRNLEIGYKKGESEND